MPGTNTVLVSIEVDPEVAAALDDPAARTRLGRVARRMFRPVGIQDLFAAMDARSDEARRRGLSDELLEAALAAYDSERRTTLPEV